MQSIAYKPAVGVISCFIDIGNSFGSVLAYPDFVDVFLPRVIKDVVFLCFFNDELCCPHQYSPLHEFRKFDLDSETDVDPFTVFFKSFQLVTIEKDRVAIKSNIDIGNA